MDSEERAYLEEMKATHTKRLRKLEIKKAQFGEECSAQVLVEIDGIKSNIDDINKKLTTSIEAAIESTHSASVAEMLIQELKDLKDQESAPIVTVYFDIPLGTESIYFVVKNTGKTSATDIKFEFDPPIQSTLDLFNDYLPVKDGMPSVAPGQEIHTLFDISHEYLNSGLPKKYTVKISYSGGILNKRREDTQVLDLSVYMGRTYVSEKSDRHR